MTKPLPAGDLAHTLAHARDPFLSLQNKNIFLTGGTGFFGHWLLESLLHANRELQLNVHATVLTRNAAAFHAKSPHIATDPTITLLEGDVRSFAFPTEPHTHILHAATDAGGRQAAQSPETLAASILDGTRRVLDFAQHTGATRLLYTSTGAVYGRSTPLRHTPETYLETARPRLPPGSYEDAKRRAEQLCLDAAATDPALQPVLARCFAFVGPHLPLDRHFAIGNFIGAALAGQPIHITGDGTPRRSWLYMSDLAAWLWTMLTHGQPSRAYNVGSDESYTIAEAAHLIATTLSSRPEAALFAVAPLSSRPEAALFAAAPLSSRPEAALFATAPLSSRPEAALFAAEVERSAFGTTTEPQIALPIQIDATPDPAAPLNSYVPAIDRAREELGLTVAVPLAEALRRTAAWHGELKSPPPHNSFPLRILPPSPCLFKNLARNPRPRAA